MAGSTGTRHSNSSVSICRCCASKTDRQRRKRASVVYPAIAGGRGKENPIRGPGTSRPRCRGQSTNGPKRRTVENDCPDIIMSRTFGGKHMPEIILHHYPL